VRKQTELAQLEADRKEKELLSTTVKPAAADAQAVIARAEGAKRARIASAEADAETTRLEGGAEAQIVLTKGEAEAKALAMRADAYKQFNEAAIIQTVLAALPDIVRAAAEPMGKIDSLTVMSADGASDIVRNATRAMIESTTAIKGLTGLDVPNLIGGALGRTFGGPSRDENGDSAPPESASERISHIAEEGLTSLRAAQAAAAVKASADAAVAKAAVDEAVAKANEEAAKAVAQASQQKEAAVTAAESKAAAAVARVSRRDGNIKQWARWMADQLRQLPDIKNYGTLRLKDLAQQGPVAARGMWGTAREALNEQYGDVTVDDLLKQFEALKS
jgi:Flotillin